MWTVCWTEQCVDNANENHRDQTGFRDRWERINGRDAMDIFVTRLTEQDISIEDILVFPPDSEHDLSDRG